eukprot:gene34662-57478_t
MNKHINRRRFSASLALTAVATAALLTGCGKVPDTIKIGVAQPLSGPLGALGQDLLNGVKLAVDELNKSGYTVDGKRVTLEVVSVDDKADAATGKAVLAFFDGAFKKGDEAANALAYVPLPADLKAQIRSSWSAIVGPDVVPVELVASTPRAARGTGLDR